MQQTHKISVIIIVKNRVKHLHNLLLGLAKCQNKFQVIVIHMNEVASECPDFLKQAYISYSLNSDSKLPLAEARNQGAKLASGEQLIFLDVDCIPGIYFIQDYANVFYKHKKTAIFMGEVYYLPSDFPNNWSDNDLILYGKKHQARTYLNHEQSKLTDRYELFWSLNFSVSKHVFHKKIGGFNKEYNGYGAEDTDFSFQARKCNVPLYWIKGAKTYHQHHGTYSPPLNHFDDIIKNATIFKKNWNIWAMEEWLNQFYEYGYINWTLQSDIIEILQRPTEEDIAKSKCS